MIIAAVDKFSKPLKQATAMIGKLGSMAKGVGKVIGGLGLIVAAAAAAFVALGKKAFDALDDIGKTADRTGLAVEQLQALRLGAVESGTTVEALNKSVEKFAKNIGDVAVKGTGEATYALDRMGIQIRKNNGTLKSNSEILDEVVIGINTLGSDAEKASALMSFFGREGIKMNQVFGEGIDTLRQWSATAEEMGIIINARSIKAVESFNDRFAELKFMVGGLVNQTFAALAPGLDAMITRFKDFAVETANANGGLEKIGQFLATQMIEAIAGTIEAVGRFGDGLEQTVLDLKHSFFELHITILEVLQDLPFAKDQTEKIAEVVAKFAFATGSAGKTAKVLADEVRKIGAAMLEAKTPIDDIKNGLDGIIATETSLSNFANGFFTVFNNGIDKFEDFAALGTKVATTLEKGLTDAFMNIGKGAEGLKDTMDQIAKMIISELIRVMIVQQAVGAVAGFFGFTPRAKGGPVTGGRPYLVGEEGPELFVPGQSGGIVPNNGLAMAGAGGGSTNINITYDIKAFDAKDATAAIAEQAPTIVGIVEQSFRKRGKRGPLG